METGKNGVRGGAPEQFFNPCLISQWDTSCLCKTLVNVEQETKGNPSNEWHWE